jgi:release factor glutamine methyltransferase
VTLPFAATTRRGALKEAVALMKAAGLDTPVLDARLIVQHALGLDWDDLFMKADQPLDAAERDRLPAALSRRRAHEPVSRIVGKRHFWTLELAVSPDTLDPRADTETLVEAVIAAYPDKSRALRMLDLGTGTGAILLSLLRDYPNAEGTGVDISDGALGIARANAESHGLADRATFRAGDWTAGLDGPFDIILSNPPYIASGDLAGLPPDVRDYDPMAALDGGADGLDAYRAILPQVPDLLWMDGLAAFEVGMGQADAVSALGSGVGLREIGRRKDLGGIERVVAFRRAGVL